MTAISGVAGDRSRHELERICRHSIDAHDLYARRGARIVTTDGASFAAALFETTPEDFHDCQPLTAGPILLAADVRIDNRSDLLEALGQPDLASTSADSEILLAAWMRFGGRLFEKLVGSFAFAIFDSSTRTLTLARGVESDRPLCYSMEGDCIRFASMPSGIVHDRRFSPDFHALARLMACGDMALGDTAFEKVRAVPPAHFLEWSPRGHRLVRYWRPPAVDEGIDRDVREEFRHLLSLAVGARLRRTGGAVASHLSAGFDSSAVTSTAAKMVPDSRELIAFTMVPARGVPLSVPRRYIADESALAGETAHLLGIKQRLVSHSGPLLDCLTDHSRYYQAPVPTVTNYGWGNEIARQAAGAGAPVLLSAPLGNASVSFGGIDLLAEWLHRGRLIEYLREARALVRNGSARWRGALFYSFDDFFPKALWERLAGMPSRTAADLFIRPEWMKRVANDRIGADCDDARVRQSQYGTYADSDFGMFTKGTLGKHGLDERDATADRRLIEFCLRLPAEYYLHDGVTRRLAREGLADRLPQSIIRNQVRGYQGADWFAKLDPRSALEWIEEIKASRSAPQVVDIAELRRAVERWDRIAAMPPLAQRQWGHRFTRAIAVGAFLRDAERDLGSFGRKVHARRTVSAPASTVPAM
jgi:asparagine synthase (glutamine-hydrolysing)